jgi:hypothetical protein
MIEMARVMGGELRRKVVGMTVAGVMRVGQIEGDGRTEITPGAKTTKEFIERMLEVRMGPGMAKESLTDLSVESLAMCTIFRGRRMKTLLHGAFHHIVQRLVRPSCLIVIFLGSILVQHTTICTQSQVLHRQCIFRRPHLLITPVYLTLLLLGRRLIHPTMICTQIQALRRQYMPRRLHLLHFIMTKQQYGPLLQKASCHDHTIQHHCKKTDPYLLPIQLQVFDMKDPHLVNVSSRV